MSVECPECGGEWSSLALHWYHNPNHRPELTREQKEIATGLVMGDAWVNRNGVNPYIRIAVIQERYLQYLNDIFGEMSTGVKLKMTAEESAAAMDRDFTTSVNEENYHDVYTLSFRSHPWFKNLSWYGNNGKVFPETLEITPTTFKHWYVCDGHYNQNDGFIVVSTSNEIENRDKMENIFKRSEIPCPDAWDEHNIRWRNESIDTIFNVIGEYLPGFEYKWP